MKTGELQCATYLLEKYKDFIGITGGLYRCGLKSLTSKLAISAFRWEPYDADLLKGSTPWFAQTQVFTVQYSIAPF